MASKRSIIEEVFGIAKSDLLEKKKFIPGKTRIPATYPDLQPEDVATLVDCVLEYWYTEHKWAERFKDALKEYLGMRYCTLTNSGSSASLAAISSAVKVHNDPRNLILTCATGFPTTVSPIYQNGKIPFYIDVDPYTLHPNMDQINQAIAAYGDDICGAIFAHTLGFPFQEEAMRMLVGSGRFLISDCCDALGASILDSYGQRFHVGFFSDMATLSFFPAHHIMTGEGGAVLSNIHQYAEMSRSIVNWGRSCFCRPGEQNACGHRFDWKDRGTLPDGWDHKYIFSEVGYNLKMTDIQASLGVSQMSRVNEMNKRRLSNYDYLKVGLSDLSNYIKFISVPDWSFPSPFGFPILVSDKMDTNSLIHYLQTHGIETRRVFGGNLTRQPGFMNLPYVRASTLEGSDAVMNRMFWVSSSPSLSEEMMNYMVDTFYGYFGE